ncbi:MAG: septal ring lytic transglycosylase RlpA family protein [Verrucomicrobiaceae bacterium]|nr:septal ring lytic transglycosylase RlpA family protein [Verrucomicrobiaceae bacterium]
MIARLTFGNRKLLWGGISTIFLTGCDFATLGRPAGTSPPSVSVKRIDEGAHPGYKKTGEVFSGTVSWYSVKTNGGTRTASGERFSNSGETAAHKTLPFGTRIQVTNLANGKSVVLRVNDRGPHTKGRVLDVSIGAAKKLDFVGRGITRCRIEVLRPDE